MNFSLFDKNSPGLKVIGYIAVIVFTMWWASTIMREDIQITHAAYMSVPTMKINGDLIAWFIAALPTMTSVIIPYLALKEKAQARIAWIKVFGSAVTVADSVIDTLFKAKTAPLLMSMADALFTLTFLSEVVAVYLVVFAIQQFGDFKEAVNDLVQMNAGNTLSQRSSNSNRKLREQSRRSHNRNRDAGRRNEWEYGAEQ